RLGCAPRPLVQMVVDSVRLLLALEPIPFPRHQCSAGTSNGPQPKGNAMNQDRKQTQVDNKPETETIARGEPLADGELNAVAGGLLQSATSNAIKAIGEGITKMASKQ